MIKNRIMENGVNTPHRSDTSFLFRVSGDKVDESPVTCSVYFQISEFEGCENQTPSSSNQRLLILASPPRTFLRECHILTPHNHAAGNPKSGCSGTSICSAFIVS